MTDLDKETLQRRYKEYLDLLPLTLAIAGLPPGEKGRSFTPEQMEARVNVVKSAFRLARQAVRESIRENRE